MGCLLSVHTNAAAAAASSGRWTAKRGGKLAIVTALCGDDHEQKKLEVGQHALRF